MAGPERTIRVGGYQGEASVHTQALRAFAAQMERELPERRVEVTANVADLGHKAADCLAMVADGRLELCYFNSSYLAERVPSLALFGSLALAVTMVGAIITHLFIVGGNPAIPIVLLAATTTIAWLRRSAR